jgi:hypothetical protein
MVMNFQVAMAMPSQLLQLQHPQRCEPRWVFGAEPFLLEVNNLTLMIQKLSQNSETAGTGNSKKRVKIVKAHFCP